jgi:gas vesicle protein
MTNPMNSAPTAAKEALSDATDTGISASKDWFSRIELMVRFGIRLAPLLTIRSAVALLGRGGLRRTRTTTMEAAAAFASGVLVGGAVTALVSPWSGPELRAKVSATYRRLEVLALAKAEGAKAKVVKLEHKIVDGAAKASAKAKALDRRDAIADTIRDVKKPNGLNPSRG